MESNNKGPILIDGSAYPSVSKILSSDPKRKSFFKAKALKKKQTAFDSDSRTTGLHRGTSLHETFASYITTGDANIPPIYYRYWDQLFKLVSGIEIQPIWAEKPLLPEHSHFTNGDTSVIWSKKYKYLGTPDLIARVGGVLCVVEIKTSRDYYTKNYDRRNFATYSQWLPYYSAATQVSAYASAWNECTEDNIDTGLVINVTEDDSQLFVVEAPEMKTRFTAFKKLVREYHKH